MLFMVINITALAPVCEDSALSGLREVPQDLSEGEENLQFPVGSPDPPRADIKDPHAVELLVLNIMLRLGIV